METIAMRIKVARVVFSQDKGSPNIRSFKTTCIRVCRRQDIPSQLNRLWETITHSHNITNKRTIVSSAWSETGRIRRWHGQGESTHGKETTLMLFNTLHIVRVRWGKTPSKKEAKQDHLAHFCSVLPVGLLQKYATRTWRLFQKLQIYSNLAFRYVILERLF